MAIEFIPAGGTITVSSGGECRVSDPLPMDDIVPLSAAGGSLGTVALPYAVVFTRAVQADAGEDCVIQAPDGSPVFTAGVDGPNEGLSFFSAAVTARPAAYTPTNVTPDRAYDADTVAVAELADVVGTLIADLQAYGLLQ